MGGYLPIPIPVIGFGELMARVEELLDTLRRHAERIIANCERYGVWLGGLAVAIERLRAELQRLVDRVGTDVGRYLTAPGHPYALWVNGDRWITEVGAAAGDRAGAFTDDFMRSDDRWSGPAAETYLRALPPQRAALLKVHSIAGEVGVSLHEIALAICAFWAAVAVATLTAVTELALAVPSSASPVTAPAGVAAAAASLAKFLVFFGCLAGALKVFLESAGAAHTGLLRQLDDNTAFPGPPAGHWPRSTAENVSDGSVSDGDPSAWSLRY